MRRVFISTSVVCGVMLLAFAAATFWGLPAIIDAEGAIAFNCLSYLFLQTVLFARIPVALVCAVVGAWLIVDEFGRP